jgi:hypothetical protein
MTYLHRTKLNFSSASLALLVFAGQASAADFGTIKGRFVFQGAVKETPIQPTKDVEYCSQHKLFDETIVVGKEQGLQNVFVFLSPARGKKVEIHASYDAAAAAKEPKVLDNKGCRFEPHAMVLWTAQPLEVHNSDEGIGHNTNASYFFVNAKFNETVPNDKPLLKTFTKSESYPSKVACNVHPWMNAHILIRDNPYMTVSAEDGTFEIANVPAGKQTFAFWHEAKGNLRDLKVGAAKADRKGQVVLDVPVGKTLDLGDVAITAANLGK